MAWSEIYCGQELATSKWRKKNSNSGMVIDEEFDNEINDTSFK